MSPKTQAPATGMSTMEREVKMFLGLPPYQHDQNTAKGNQLFFDDLTARYGHTVIQTTMQRLSKEYMQSLKRGDVQPTTPLDAKTGRTLGDTVDDAIKGYQQQVNQRGGIRLLEVSANDYAVIVRIGQTDLTLSREATPTDAKRVAAEFCEKLARAVMQL